MSRKEIISAIEKDNTSVLKSALQDGWESDIIFGKDRYGWTSLMVAACAGSLETVKLLLEKGANLNERDRSGNTCLTLAKKSKHYKIVNHINLHLSGKLKKPEKLTVPKKAYDVPFETKCNLCNVVFHSQRLSKQHLSSTVHLLNLERKEIEANGGHPKVYYGIPEANRGFQMMLSKGWDSNVGLGPAGKGKLYPVKTILKRDKHGLGLEVSHKDTTESNSKKAKVTHFGPYDSSSIETDTITKRTENLATLNKKERVKKANKLKHKEISFRREFMSL